MKGRKAAVALVLAVSAIGLTVEARAASPVVLKELEVSPRVARVGQLVTVRAFFRNETDHAIRSLDVGASTTARNAKQHYVVPQEPLTLAPGESASLVALVSFQDQGRFLLTVSGMSLDGLLEPQNDQVITIVPDEFTLARNTTAMTLFFIVPGLASLVLLSQRSEAAAFAYGLPLGLLVGLSIFVDPFQGRWQGSAYLAGLALIPPLAVMTGTVTAVHTIRWRVAALALGGYALVATLLWPAFAIWSLPGALLLAGGTRLAGRARMVPSVLVIAISVAWVWLQQHELDEIVLALLSDDLYRVVQ